MVVLAIVVLSPAVVFAFPPAPVPDGGGTALLLLLSIGGIGIARRLMSGNRK
jgi:hypothetical protein